MLAYGYTTNVTATAASAWSTRCSTQVHALAYTCCELPTHGSFVCFACKSDAVGRRERTRVHSAFWAACTTCIVARLWQRMLTPRPWQEATPPTYDPTIWCSFILVHALILGSFTPEAQGLALSIILVGLPCSQGLFSMPACMHGSAWHRGKVRVVCCQVEASQPACFTAQPILHAVSY